MLKQEFLDTLNRKLSNLPKKDVEERLNFYSEMIEDRIEEGLSEEDAVAGIGSVDEIAAQIAAQIAAELPFAKDIKTRITPKKRLTAREIVPLVLGSPIWLSLAIAAVAVIISLYAALWSLIIALWAVFGSLVGCALGGVVAGIAFAINANGLTGTALIGAGFICAGLAIFLFFGGKAATNGTLLLTQKIVLNAKKRLIKKEEI